jgi:hypothetical protein
MRWEKRDSNPCRIASIDLQSIAFSHSAILPFLSLTRPSRARTYTFTVMSGVLYQLNYRPKQKNRWGFGTKWGAIAPRTKWGAIAPRGALAPPLGGALVGLLPPTWWGSRDPLCSFAFPPTLFVQEHDPSSKEPSAVKLATLFLVWLLIHDYAQYSAEPNHALCLERFEGIHPSKAQQLQKERIYTILFGCNPNR